MLNLLSWQILTAGNSCTKTTEVILSVTTEHMFHADRWPKIALNRVGSAALNSVLFFDIRDYRQSISTLTSIQNPLNGAAQFARAAWVLSVLLNWTKISFRTTLLYLMGHAEYSHELNIRAIARYQAYILISRLKRNQRRRSLKCQLCR